MSYKLSIIPLNRSPAQGYPAVGFTTSGPVSSHCDGTASTSNLAMLERASLPVPIAELRECDCHLHLRNNLLSIWLVIPSREHYSMGTSVGVPMLLYQNVNSFVCTPAPQKPTRSGLGLSQWCCLLKRISHIDTAQVFSSMPLTKRASEPIARQQCGQRI